MQRHLIPYTCMCKCAQHNGEAPSPCRSCSSGGVKTIAKCKKISCINPSRPVVCAERPFVPSLHFVYLCRFFYQRSIVPLLPSLALLALARAERLFVQPRPHESTLRCTYYMMSFCAAPFQCNCIQLHTSHACQTVDVVVVVVRFSFVLPPCRIVFIK